MNKVAFYIIICLIGYISYSCNSCSNKKNTNQLLDFDSIQVIDSIEAIFYALPSPEEIITYINDHKVSFKQPLLHNYNLSKHYQTKTKKTIVCGVYFSDLAYISAFKKSDLSGDYISTIDYLLNDLEIHPDFTINQQRRLINASVNADSLYQISRELYDTVINYLQEYDEGKTLSLLSVGAITECLYVTTHLHNNFEEQKGAINRIAEQKLLFDDIIKMIMVYKDDEDVKPLMNDLYTIKRSFDNLDYKTFIKNINKNKDGSLHIESKSVFDLQEENYFIFSDNIRDFRNVIIRTSTN